MFPSLEEIKKRRLKLGISQHRLARETQVGQSTIAKIENGKTEPTYRMVSRIFEYFDTQQDSNIGEIGSIATRPVISVRTFDSVRNAVSILREKGFKQLPVSDRGRLVGSVSERGISSQILQTSNPATLMRKAIREVMDEALPQAPERTAISDLIPLLQRNQAVLTTKRGQVTGIVTNADLLRLLTKFA